MQSPASKNFALLFSLTCIGAALKLIYSGIYLIGAPLLLIGVVWFASTIRSVRH
jgi:hypothetical protein